MKHQGVIAYAAAYNYATVEDILAKAEEAGEPPFIFLLDGIEDPHNLGAIIRTANLAGAHGVIIPKNRAVGLTANGSKNFCRSVELHTGSKSNKLKRNHERTEKTGTLVCLCRYGW